MLTNIFLQRFINSDRRVTVAVQLLDVKLCTLYLRFMAFGRSDEEVLIRSVTQSQRKKPVYIESYVFIIYIHAFVFLFDSSTSADCWPRLHAVNSFLKSNSASSANSARRKALCTNLPSTESSQRRLPEGFDGRSACAEASRMAPDPHGQEESGPVGSIIAGHKISLNVHYDNDDSDTGTAEEAVALA